MNALPAAAHREAASPLLTVHGLGVSFGTRGDQVQATRDIGFDIQPGERVGIVGESGCGKTVTGLALLGLLPPATSHIVGSAIFEGQNLIGLANARLRRVRGRRIKGVKPKAA